MILNLRRKFVLIIMALVGTVLITVLGSTYVSAWQTQHSLTNEALERGIEGELVDMPRMALGAKPGEDDRRNEHRANMIVLSINVDEDGVVLATNNAPVLIDADALTEVVSDVLASPNDQGWDETRHIAWMRDKRDDGSWRIVLADTSTQDISLRTLLIRDIVITVVALLVLLLISILLTKWMLSPVSEAWEQQRRFVADASHELKTPLAVIIANTQILQNDATLTDESKRWIESTAEESKHMKGLVEELLELARTDESIQGAQGVMQREDLDFSSLAESASLEFDAVAFEKGCLIDESIAPDIHVEGDKLWLARLCKILIDNACKYSDTGKTISVSLAREGKRCRFAVNNRGAVIDPEDIGHVFDRFYRSDKARSRDADRGGFGLGLAIAKGIVESHGGTISVTSTEEEGTTFAFELPCKA